MAAQSYQISRWHLVEHSPTAFFSLAKTSPKSEMKNQKFKIQVFLQVFNHRREKK